MPTIKFKAKVETIHNMDGTFAFQRVKVPAFSRNHCDMAAFRKHPRFGSYANSDLFPSMICRALTALGVGSHVRLDDIPASVTVDASGFLARVTVTLA